MEQKYGTCTQLQYDLLICDPYFTRDTHILLRDTHILLRDILRRKSVKKAGTIFLLSDLLMSHMVKIAGNFVKESS